MRSCRREGPPSATCVQVGHALEALSSVTSLIVGVVLSESRRDRLPSGFLAQSSAFAAIGLNTMVASISIMFGKQPFDATEQGLLEAQRNNSKLSRFSTALSSTAFYHCLSVSGFMLYLVKLISMSIDGWEPVDPSFGTAWLRNRVLQDKGLLQIVLQVQTAGIRCARSVPSLSTLAAVSSLQTPCSGSDRPAIRA